MDMQRWEGLAEQSLKTLPEKKSDGGKKLYYRRALTLPYCCREKIGARDSGHLPGHVQGYGCQNLVLGFVQERI